MNVANWDNYCYVPARSVPNVGCSSNAIRGDLGHESDANGGGIADSSHVLVGYNPAEAAPCPVGGRSHLSHPAARRHPQQHLGRAGPRVRRATKSTGNDTLIGCEYYVPSGVTMPSDFLINGTTYHCGNNARPAAARARVSAPPWPSWLFGVLAALAATVVVVAASVWRLARRRSSSARSAPTAGGDGDAADPRLRPW